MGLIARIVIVFGATLSAAGVMLLSVPIGLIYTGLIFVAYAAMFLLEV